MRSNLNDDDNDPALVSKKFWSHVKSVSNCSITPELVFNKGCFSDNIQGQTELFNNLSLINFIILAIMPNL